MTITTVAAAPTWMDDAACAGPAGADEEAWFPISSRSDDALMAVKICAARPVRIDCLTKAIKDDTRHGIWGGINLGHIGYRKRARLRRVLAAAEELWS